jgi:hypothetical protein
MLMEADVNRNIWYVLLRGDGGSLKALRADSCIYIQHHNTCNACVRFLLAQNFTVRLLR